MISVRNRVQASGSLQTASLVGGAPVLPPRPHWHDQAACNGATDVDFFPDAAEAKKAGELNDDFCRFCPVRVTCLAGALKRGDHGIWAGTTRDERRKLMRTRPRAKCPKCQCQTLIPIDEYDVCHSCGVSWKTGRRHGEQDQIDDA